MERAFQRALAVPDQIGSESVSVLSARSNCTPTSSLLPAIEERRCARRRRRKHQNELNVAPASGFPVPSVQVDGEIQNAPSNVAENTPILARYRAAEQSSTTAMPFWSDACNTVTQKPGNQEELSSFSTESRSKLRDKKMMSDISAENTRRVHAMSPNEVESELKDIRERIPSELLSMLKERGKQKELKKKARETPGSAQDHECLEPKVNKSISFSSHADPCTASNATEPAEDDGNCLSVDGSRLSELYRSSRTLSTLAENVELARKLADAVSLRNQRDLEQMEKGKLEWTFSAEDPEMKRKSAVLDTAVRRSVKALGEVADWRFDLSGRQLSEAEIESLPMHLGLHHHGTQPGAAGYTLGDLVLLSRSSVLGQRIIALETLAKAFEQYGDRLVVPLNRTGGLDALVVHDLPGGREGVLRHHISYNRAYVAMIFALAQHAKSNKCRQHIVGVPAQQLYFVSEMYCAPPSQLGDDAGACEVLARSRCANSLIIIASNMLACREWYWARLALNTCFEIVETVTSAGFVVVEDARASSVLFSIVMSAVSNGGENSGECVEDDWAKHSKTLSSSIADGEERAEVICCACKVAATCAALSGWSGRLKSITGSKGFLSVERLTRISDYISRYSLSAVGAESCRESALLSFGALRIFRAAIAFGHGLEVLGGVLSCLPVVARRGAPQDPAAAICEESVESCAAEAYLTLEAYCHALYTHCLIDDRGDLKSEREPGTSDASSDVEIPQEQTEGKMYGPNVQLMKDKLRQMVPAALDAASVFAAYMNGSESEHGTRENRLSRLISAAAGHFTATVLAMTSGAQVFLSPQVVARVCEIGLSSSQEARNVMVSRLSGNVEDPMIASSVAHAAARILPRAACPPDILHLSLERIIEAVHKSAVIFSASTRLAFSPFQRVIVSSAAEWLGSVSRRHPSTANVHLTLSLLPQCVDAQVVADVIARNILSPRAICAMDSRINMDFACEMCGELLPYTLSCVLSADSASEHRGVRNLPLTSLVPLYTCWLACEKEQDFARANAAARLLDAMRQCGSVSSSDIYEAVVLGVCGAFLLAKPDANWTGAVMDAGRALRRENLFCTRMDDKGSDIPHVLRKESAIVDKLMQYSECLVAHGPGGSETAVIASIVCTAMLRKDIELSICRRLWQRTVVECGGATLFQHAELHGDISQFVDDRGRMTDLYATALSRDLRCDNTKILQVLWMSVAHALSKNSAQRMHLAALLDTHEGQTVMHREMCLQNSASLADHQRRIIQANCRLCIQDET